MSICSFALCLSCFLSVPALFMARSELARIDRGEIGPNNRGNAQAAYWIAAVNLGLSLLGIAAYVVMILAVAASGAR